jgi:hypothetical protein
LEVIFGGGQFIAEFVNDALASFDVVGNLILQVGIGTDGFFDCFSNAESGADFTELSEDADGKTPSPCERKDEVGGNFFEMGEVHRRCFVVIRFVVIRAGVTIAGDTIAVKLERRT